MTLRLRLGVTGVLLLGVLGLAGYLLIRSVWAVQVAQIDRQLTGSAPVVLYSLGNAGPGRGLSDLASASGAPAGPDIPASGGVAVQARLNDFYVAVVSGDRRRVLLAPSVDPGQAPRAPAGAPRVLTALRPATVSSFSGAGRWRAVLVAGTGGEGVLLAQSLSRVEATTGRVRLVASGAGMLVLIVMFAAGYWVERLGLRPITRVTRVADAISAGKRSRRVDVRGSPRSEASHLARAFNIMLDEEQASQDRLRRFVGDASHELRTPVSVIQGLAEIWSQGSPLNGADLDEMMRRIGQESRRMADLVENLLLLARLDERKPVRRGEIDLAALVRDVAFDASLLHPSRDLTCDAKDSAIVLGDESGLRQVVSNLCQNALIHTPPTASVALSVAVDDAGGRAVLEVRDTGPGMTAQDAERAFDRFWRADASRVRPGSGLGLPIVAAIVTAHGGSVTIESSPDLGTLVRAVLPAAGPSSKPATGVQEAARLGGKATGDAEQSPGRAVSASRVAPVPPGDRRPVPRDAGS
ncbi:sensor histidine kinase [Pseudofrankia inefficax]|uniref:histidine kinase n=1 Tax=Pseudofrankia inefficax (strain DSM 45817 / CECT 9037 / DDB 130130 / EuI1c) TaxID=298654 RepID=E3J839_PSEI1|nr:HAMP domain-containing sensor histidine kinase [Pseudofrankia inefficax]ADP82087.1 integral membrane sensor signal transduction histidine kinase [Pseudofrankia inefficax]